MYHSYSYYATTNDNKNVSLCVQTINGFDAVLAQNIKCYVANHVNVNLAISNSNPQIATTTLIDGNKANRIFYVGFALDYTNQFLNVVNPDLISFIEIM